MSRIEITGFSAGYDGEQVLHDVDLDVADGTVLTLLGASGSGKTTLLRAVAGFLEPTAGVVRAGERVLVETGRVSVPPERRNLAMVFQHHAVWPHLSVAENVAYPLRRRGVGRAERAARLEHALDVVGLAELAGRCPDTLSGGQRQRVALARAIVARPEALLLDEALSALDEPLRAALRLTLRRLVDTEGMTVLQVTHDRDEALALADRIAVLDAGRVAQVGTPAELVDAPASPAVARFLHDAAVVDGVVGEDGGFTAGELRIPASVLTTAGRGDGVRGPASLALLPQALHVVLAGAGHGEASVETSLFGRTGTTVICRWLDQEVRATGGSDPVRPGDVVGLRIERGVLYPR